MILFYSKFSRSSYSKLASRSLFQWFCSTSAPTILTPTTLSTRSTTPLFQWYVSASAPTILSQSWLLDLYFNHIVQQVLPKFLLNIETKSITPLFQWYVSASAPTILTLPYFSLHCSSLQLLLSTHSTFIVKNLGEYWSNVWGEKCLRRILFKCLRLSHNFHLLVEKFAIGPPTILIQSWARWYLKWPKTFRSGLNKST